MWSGPRNISTAMMRSFGARTDSVVVDEPLYAHYLRATGLDHPLREEVLASQPQRWQDAVEQLLRPLPDGVQVQYQKHMTHHLLPQIGTDWMAGLRHAYLIRDPARVIASYARVRADPELADLGFQQQAEIFERFAGPVVDADDLLRDPPRLLRRLCEALDIEFHPSMLSWPTGPRDSDGAWAPRWYASVEASTGFATTGPAGPEGSDGSARPELPERLQPLLEVATGYYDQLAAHRLQ